MSDVGFADGWLGYSNEAARRAFEKDMNRILAEDMARIGELRGLFAAAEARAVAAEAERDELREEMDRRNPGSDG